MLECFRNLYIKNLKFNIATTITLVLMMFVANSVLYDNYKLYRQLSYLDHSRHDFYYLENVDMKSDDIQHLQIAKYDITLSAWDEKENEFYLYEADDVMLQIDMPVRSGRWLDPNASVTECVIGAGLAGDYKMGDSIKISGNGDEYSAKIVGILNSSGYLLRDMVQTSDPTFSDLLVSYGDEICITNHISPDEIAEQIKNAYAIPDELFSKEDLANLKKSGTEIYSYADIKENTQKAFSDSVTTSIFFIVLTFILMAAFLCFSIYTTTYSQRDTIEIYRNCGATDRQITAIVMAQTTATLMMAVIILLFIMAVLQGGARGQDMFGRSIVPHIIWTMVYGVIVEIVQYGFLRFLAGKKEYFK